MTTYGYRYAPERTASSVRSLTLLTSSFATSLTLSAIVLDLRTVLESSTREIQILEVQGRERTMDEILFVVGCGQGCDVTHHHFSCTSGFGVVLADPNV